MRAPAFWGQAAPTLAAHLLRPAASLYGALAARRLARRGADPAVPVICVGNFTAGGAGKTPTALAIARLLQGSGARPAFLLRGYGGRLAGPVKVDVGVHGPRDVGDEALLLNRVAPTIVARDRVAGARLCAEAGANVVVMDDGLQNPSLKKSFSLCVIDAAVGIGNGLCLPAGPLRAPLAAQWPLVDALVVVGEGAAGDRLTGEALSRGKGVLRAHLQPDERVAQELRGCRVLAFAGIGRPDKFFATLEELGAEVVSRRAFGDHHAFAEEEIAALVAEARRGELRLVTTEKDFVRLAPLGGEMSGDIIALPVLMVFKDEEALRQALADQPLAPKASTSAAI
jgi:tetraacyldisaccharide 4'-kinase